MIITRDNSLGLRFIITKLNDEQTKITHGKNSIIVRMNIHDLSAAWFKWQMNGMKIQYAFDQLNASEREFIMTGISPEEWSKLFPSE